MARYDWMGLLWMLKGEHVVALTATGARLSSGADVLPEGVGATRGIDDESAIRRFLWAGGLKTQAA
jgi:hypothetical protein